ncbi:MAG TPA: hypothetical protein VHE58_01150 [Burkholderiales bacterium]|nr:hypothetical protein [Burkholderiales bacterium]
MSDSSVESRAEEQLMRVAPIVGLLFVLLTAGCAGVKPAAPDAGPQSGAPQGGAEALAPVVSPATSPSQPPQAGAPQDGAAAVEPTGRPATPSTTRSTGQNVTKPDSPGAKTPAKVPPSPLPTAQLPKKDSITPDLGKQKASPPLDLASLEKRLKETKAIGVFTKITLKNQVDDLLNQFRAFYQGRVKTTLAELRQPYDLLLLKVLSLLQDSDPSLAAAIVTSREAIWSILADPAKFATI